MKWDAGGQLNKPQFIKKGDLGRLPAFQLHQHHTFYETCLQPLFFKGFGRIVLVAATRRTRASRRSEDEKRRVNAAGERKGTIMTFNEIQLAIAARDRQLEAIAGVLASLAERLNYLLRPNSN